MQDSDNAFCSLYTGSNHRLIEFSWLDLIYVSALFHKSLLSAQKTVNFICEILLYGGVVGAYLDIRYDTSIHEPSIDS